MYTNNHRGDRYKSNYIFGLSDIDVFQVGSPEEHISDTFYFVEDKLVMHNKAYFQYV